MEHDSLRAVVIGGRLSGLETPLLLEQRGFSHLTVLEKRSQHTRANFILLNHLGASRLRDLGVYDLWKSEVSAKTEYYDRVFLRGNVEELIAGMKAQGVFPKKASDKEAQFRCLRDMQTIVERCRSCGVDIKDDEAGSVASYENIPHQAVVSLHDQGTGIEFVVISDLERVMAKLAVQQGVELVYSCGNAELVKNLSGEEIEQVRFFREDNVLKTLGSPDLILLCEGSRRSIATKQLLCDQTRASISQWYVLFEADKYYGPDLFLSINMRDPSYPDARLRHLACGGIQNKNSTFFYFQIPDELAKVLCEEEADLPVSSKKASQDLHKFILRHLEEFAKLHHLEIAHDLLWTSSVFESRESYVENP